MLRNRNEYPQFITDIGTVAWASIDEADYEYKEEGEFHIRVRFDADADLSAMRGEAEAILDEAYKAMEADLKREKKGALLKKLHRKDDVIPMEVDSKTGDETGYLIIRAGMKHKVTPKSGKYAGKELIFTPDVFDARGKKLNRRPKIGSGSKVKIAVRPMEYFIAKDGEMGISWKLEAVQIIKLIQGGSRDAASYGFGQEDGDAIDDAPFGDEGEGYTADDNDADGNSDF
jgi:hypothetical protein